MCILVAIEGIGLSEMKPPIGAFIQYSCAANQTIGDATGTVRNSFFTKHLLKTINRENVEYTEIFRETTENICKENRRKPKPLSINGFRKNEQVFLNAVERELHISCLTYFTPRY